MTCGDKFKAVESIEAGLDEGLEAGLELDLDRGIFLLNLNQKFVMSNFFLPPKTKSKQCLLLLFSLAGKFECETIGSSKMHKAKAGTYCHFKPALFRTPVECLGDEK